MIDTTDPTVAALLAACIANPDDLTAALVFADALQEQGDEARAEFIRVCCELQSRGFPAPNDERTHELARRDRELLQRHERAWRSAGKCPECGGVGGWQKRLGNSASFWQTCHACWGTGDAGGLLVMPPAVLRDEGDGTPAVRYSHPVRWRRGLIDRVEVPRLEECFEWRRKRCTAPGCDGGLIGRPPRPRGPGTQWMGMMCGECDGTGEVVGREWVPTPWLRAVVTHHPTVREVVPLDREPQSHTREGDWFWVAQICDDPPSHALPKALFDAIHGGDRHSMTPGSYCAFDTREAAVSALGRAVVRVARG